MKYLVIFVAVVVVTAEPPRYRQRLQRVQAPYPAAGFRPSIAFTLPSRVEDLPQQYGPPPNPPSVYGPPEETPEETPEEIPETTTTEQPTEEPATEAQRFTQRRQNAKLIKSKEEDAEEVEVDSTDNKEQNDQPQQQGIYYILLPTGQLQKVQYLTNGNVENAAYTAQLQYQAVDPIRGPIFGLDSNGQLVQYA